MPRRKSVIDAVIQQLSPVLGSAAVVAVTALGLGTLATVIVLSVACLWRV